MSISSLNLFVKVYVFAKNTLNWIKDPARAAKVWTVAPHLVSGMGQIGTGKIA